MSGKKRVLCPACGKHAGGNFCQHCGTSLGGQFCRQCGADIAGRFCNECGTEVEARRGRAGAGAAGGGPEGDRNDLPWWIAGAVTFALLVVFGWTVVRSADPGVTGQAVSAAPPPTADLSQMSPRQRADQLFNQVVAAAENGDDAVAQQFLPMALQAYESARPLDMDGLFHLALLQKTGEMFEDALATADEMLAREANHIMGMAIAAQAAAGLGREDEAAGFYQRILDHHDTEITRPLPEYQSHANYFGLARTEARSFLLGR